MTCSFLRHDKDDLCLPSTHARNLHFTTLCVYCFTQPPEFSRRLVRRYFPASTLDTASVGCKPQQTSNPCTLTGQIDGSMNRMRFSARS
eukprot:4745135-Amphidinium_carterae.2